MTRAQCIAAALLLVLGFATDPARAATTRDVEVRNNAYVPGEITAAPGDTIRWTWTEGMHTVTAHSGAAFDSGGRVEPFVYERTYTGGTVLYYCTFHGTPDGAGGCRGMCGRITEEDTTPPPPPAITAPAEGAETGADVVVNGTASADTVRVRVREGSSLLGETAASSGSWRVSLRPAPGSHTIVATALDRAGNESAPSAPVTFTVADVTPPTATIDRPLLPIVLRPRVFSGTASDDRAVARVVLYAQPSILTVIYSREATCTGCGTDSAQWRLVWDDLPPGDYEWVQAVAHDVYGNTGESERISVIVI